MITIRPSIASANPIDLKSELRRLGRHERDVHIDIEDGSYISNITFGLKTAEAIVRATRAVCDAHITATDPEKYMEPLARMGVSSVCFHMELMRHPLQGLNHCRHLGLRAGLALSFLTPPEQLLLFADRLDYVLLMTAEPDFEGEKFYPPILDKIEKTRRLLPQHVSLWADGGIDENTLPMVVERGADTIIMGRAIWGQQNAEAAMDRYYEIAGKHTRRFPAE